MTSIVRPVVRDVARDVVKGVVGSDIVTRNLIMQSATMQTFIKIPNVTLQLGDIVELFYLAPTSVLSGSSQYLTDGDNASGRLFSYMETNGTWDLGGHSSATLDGTIITTTSNYPTDGRLHNLRLTVGSATSLGRVGARFTNNETYSGFIYNVRVIRSDVTLRNYPLDDTLINSNVIRNSAATLGGELVTNGDFSNGLSGWQNSAALPVDTFELSNGALRIVNTTGSAQVCGSSDNIPLVAGVTYLFEADLTKTSGLDDWDISIRESLLGSVRHIVTTTATNGRVQSTLTATTTENVVIQFTPRNTFDGTIDNITIKEAPGYGAASASLSAQFSEPYQVLSNGFLQVASEYTGGALSGTVNTTVSSLLEDSVYRVILSNPTNSTITLTSGANVVNITAGSVEADITLDGTSVTITGSGITTAFTPRVSLFLESA